MASIRLIRQRIRSAKNIAQITKAMEMVAASKMKKAQEKALAGKPYADKIREATLDLAQRIDIKLNPLLLPGNPDGKTVIIIISTNKGLCGGLNTNLFRLLYKEFGKYKNIAYLTLGKKGQNFAVRIGRQLVADFSDKVPFVQNIPPVTKIIVDGFIAGLYKEVYISYSSFINALKQEPVFNKILPLILPTSSEDVNTKPSPSFTEFLVEPSPREVLESLLPHYIENQIRAAILEEEASEHSARMIAMKNATDAALDLMDSLTLLYNKARQEKITFEIADMVTARLAVEG